ncbi:metallophosphoesterase [Neptuniibacter sp. QD37_6]|uniref:metallophosphoesterase n=1 Tax=Neptuniibacter sp. QD37_6 TaxID=3398210 RepID=UPI0039F4DD52
MKAEKEYQPMRSCPQLLQHRKLSRNTQGTDFFVGDIHGEFDQLMKRLSMVGFNRDCDRLIATGDLIDRGPDSIKCLELLRKPWFYSVLGNHEAIFLKRDTDPNCRRLHQQNGGSWANSLTNKEREHYQQLIQEHMSLAITVVTKHLNVGVIHAMAPDDWQELEKPIDDWIPFLWSTQKYSESQRKSSQTISNIEFVISGHVGCSYVERGTNQVWIDTLLGSGKLTLAPISQLLSA